MIKLLKQGALGAFLLSTAYTATLNAELIPRLNGQAIYDTERDITFLADARLAKTVSFGLPYTPDPTPAPGQIESVLGGMTIETGKMWLQAMNNANYLGFSDWRLPTTLNPDYSCKPVNISNGYNTSMFPGASGTDCSGSELGHLHTIKFGWVLANGWNGGYTDAQGMFSNLGGFHLSSTEYAPDDPYVMSHYLGVAQMPYSAISAGLGINYITVWPVRDGDTADVPVSNPGIGATVHIGSSFTLDGSASSDPDGQYPLTYAWSLVSAPAGSAAGLSDPAIVNPAFTADLIGDYIFELVVTDNIGFASAPKQVTFSTYNTAPVADAGPDQVVAVNGSQVNLDGSQSYDDDGDNLTAAWGFTAKPSGSNATLSDTTSFTPTFNIDAYGIYNLSLSVTDEFGATSNADDISISFSNVKPVANPGVDQTGSTDSIFVLDGRGSSDANNDFLSYSWSITTSPEGSGAQLNNSASAQPSFTGDIAGTYIIELVVNDGMLNSDPVTVDVEVTDVQLNAIDLLTQAIDTINAIPNSRSNFKHRKAKRMLTRKLNRAIAGINRGNHGHHHGHHHHGHHDPEDILERVLKRTNGCVNNGNRDRDDWIKQCNDQTAIYNLITDAEDLL